MREILFRGKQTDNGEWIEGAYSPFHLNFGEREEKPHIIIISDDEDIDGLWCEVIPETVGQYTGLTDKNGKRIFEGDIVRATIERAERCQSPRIENGVIGYDCIGMIGLILYKDKNGENVWSDFFNELSLSGLIEDYYFEIIGNIHDNPELLGGENNGINR